MKLKDYEIPQYGLGDASHQEDLEQYSLKNFDLKAYQLTQTQPELAPIPAACEPDATPPNEQRFRHAANPVQTELNPVAVAPCDVQFGAHFSLQTVSYMPLSPAQSWKMPRWVIATVGLFFGSAAVLTLACCVVLLRDPKPAPVEQLAVPTAPVATTSVAPAQRSSNSPMPTTTAHVADRPAVRHSVAATTNVMHDDAAPARRIVASRHPGVVRRHIYGPRRVTSKHASSSEALQEADAASSRRPKDALDQLLSESSL